MTRGFRLTAIAALALLAALTIFVSSQDTTAVAPFEPGGFVCFEVTETPAECDGDSSPGAATDIHSRFCIGWNQDCSVKDSPVTDSNFGLVVGFTPPEFTGPDTIPIGSVIGRLTSEATLGLLSNPCSTVIQVAFTLMYASTNISDTLDPLPVGETDVLEPYALDANGNGLPDGVDKYPSFLNETFDGKQPVARFFGASFIQGSWVTLNFVFFSPGETFEAAGEDITLDPNLGVPGVTVLNNPEAPAAAGPISDFCAPLLSDNITLGKTMDNPCTPADVDGAACPGGDTPVFQNRGYPLFPCETGNSFDEDGDGKVNDGCPQAGANAESGAECDNDISDDLEDSDVNDGCPQVGDQSEGARIPGDCSATDEGGCSFRQNPATAGPVTFTTLSASQRDADGDGIENGLDVCALTANPGWDPRGASNDGDLDGIPDACDPDPAVQGSQSPFTCKAGIVGPDEDQDCFSNRADNCPLDNQLANPNLPPDTDNLPAPNDEDNDGIGDACDPNPNNADTEGEPSFICMKFALDVGGAQKATATYDPNQSRDCAVSSAVPTGPTPTLAPGETPVPTATGGGGNNGVDVPPDTGVGSLAPVATSVSLWAIALALVGTAGVLAGVRILRSRRVDRED